MPQRRSRRGSKKYRSRTLPQTGKRIDRRQSKAINNMSKKIKKIEAEAEVKHKDTLFAVTTIPSTGLMWESHNFITQGTTNITRIGNVIAPTSFQIRMRIAANTTKITSPTVCRIIIFWDTQVNGAGPTGFGLTGVVDDSVITVPPYAPRNYNTIDRYRILKDKVIVLHPVLATTTTDPGGVVTAVSAVVAYRKFIIKSSRKMRFTGNAGTVADITNNALYVFFMSDLTVTEPTVQGGIRMYFKDS